MRRICSHAKTKHPAPRRPSLEEPLPNLEVAPALSPAERAREAEEKIQEQKLIRRLQFMMNLVLQTIAQDGSLTIDEAAQMIADSRKAALAMFPGKELAYDLI